MEEFNPHPMLKVEEGKKPFMKVIEVAEKLDLKNRTAVVESQALGAGIKLSEVVCKSPEEMNIIFEGYSRLTKEEMDKEAQAQKRAEEGKTKAQEGDALAKKIEEQMSKAIRDFDAKKEDHELSLIKMTSDHRQAVEMKKEGEAIEADAMAQKSTAGTAQSKMRRRCLITQDIARNMKQSPIYCMAKMKQSQILGFLKWKKLSDMDDVPSAGEWMRLKHALVDCGLGLHPRVRKMGLKFNRQHTSVAETKMLVAQALGLDSEPEAESKRLARSLDISDDEEERPAKKAKFDRED